METNLSSLRSLQNEDKSLPRSKEAAMSYEAFKFLVKSDLHRYFGRSGRGLLLKNLIFTSYIGVKYTFWMRLCAYLRTHKILKYGVYQLAKFILRRYIYKYGLSIPFTANIGSGFYISHFGGIFVHNRVTIGKNCNISQGVTIGRTNRGPREGHPRLGDNVYIGAGAKIIGQVEIGDNAAIGANCVVTKDVPDNAVVVGVPGRVISYQGAADYIQNTDYE